MLKSLYERKIAEKRQDLLRLQEFKQLTEKLADQLESIGDQLEIMKDGSESVALILSNWQSIVNSISMASLGLMKYSKQDYETGAPLPETLIRVRLDKDDERDKDEQEQEQELELEDLHHSLHEDEVMVQVSERET